LFQQIHKIGILHKEDIQEQLLGHIMIVRTNFIKIRNK